MQTIELFNVPDVPECTVELPEGMTLIDADVELGNGVDIEDEIRVYYMDQRASDKLITLSWYVLGIGMEVPDAFPGRFFKRVRMSDGSARFLFFKADAKKRDPIVVKVPDEGPKRVK